MGKLSWLLWAGGKVAEKTLESLAMSFALWQRFPGWLGVFFSRHVFQKNKLMPFWVREEI
jgi:DhnA family fructose-bisphosphate aldolase class Ia